ncbi:MAG: DUF1553 domain-containing protein [Acidobacteriia bacterium]|nr:DUF1553 domain-containing protein [Terriglobia bacterium]MYK11700.1 DUF1553 domain-containing protein [Terriglobia bacterium]
MIDWKFRMLRPLFLYSGALLLLPALSAQGSAGLEHFERHVRPLLAEKCYTCHSSDTMAMGQLKLDSKESLLQGGSRGPAITPGDPSSSLLLRAVSYTSIDLKMPPSGRLSDAEVANLETWIRMGAPDPRSATAPEVEQAGIDLAEGRQFWSFRPVRQPAWPEVRNTDWARTDVDRFVLARLEAEGLEAPAGADRRTLLRRVAFDLTGLPPTPAELDAFLSDNAPGAYSRVVERLLDSPHYGERWGRHWLDLVRWAETNGHEFDNNKLDAWRFRDYVIESFNADLPYNRFLQEQIAGDLMPPRLSSDGTHYVNPIASGMYWLWEVLNSPTDSVKARADQIDNQIDVLTKATQGLTVACARCHDHKFDPIPTADYYSLFGILASTHMNETCIDSPERASAIRAADREIGGINGQIAGMLQGARGRAAEGLAERLVAASKEAESEDSEGLAAELAYAADEPSHPLYPFASMAKSQAAEGAAEFGDLLADMRREMSEWAAKADRSHQLWSERGDEIFEDFEGGFGKWTVNGAGFGSGPVRHLPPSQRLGGHWGQAVAASSGQGADALVGTLTTEKFRMPARYVHVRLAGPQSDRRLKEDAPARFTVIADEHKSGHAMPDGSGRLRWRTIAMTKERGRICSIEIVDRDREGSITVDRVVFSSAPKPPPISGPVSARVLDLLADEAIRSLPDLALAYEALARTLSVAASGPVDDALLSGILGHIRREQAAKFLAQDELERYFGLVSRRNRLDQALPASTFAMSSRDWQPADSPIHVRGNHKNAGEIAPRQFLQVIAGSEQDPYRSGSGRLELAQWVASEKNPLTARVMANRVWHHHFGRGIVASPDNFGRMGEEPTHPALLDFLARKFMDSGWSVKGLHREIVLSSTYRASSAPSERAKASDPSNRLLSHFPVRRLEAEAIRDSLLAVSGALDRSIGGPGVPPHISEYQDGRGKPASGPLDGLGRRSIYLQVRRNFLPPLFLAFDYPLPISTEGRRGVSAVASQALLMLNNEFVNGQARLWAERTLQANEGTQERIEDMYMRAYGRPPEESEVSEIEGFLASQVRLRDSPGLDDPAVWADLAHAVLNAAEFLFVR